MAILFDPATCSRHVLKPYHVFGRSTFHANSVLLLPTISLMHACARWDEGQWTFADQSRNGCFINGHRLARDLPIALQAGDEIQFGSLAATPWSVDDLGPPADLLLPTSRGGRIITLGSFHALPDDAAPEACLYRGHDGQWLLETRDGVEPLGNGDAVCLGAETWRLVCAVPEPRTVVHDAFFPCMRFHSSLDEEHVHLTVSRGLATQAFGERSHHYLVLLLARQRLSDATRRLDSYSMGWVELDRLAQWLGIDKAHLNVQIFRLRKQFEQLAVRGLIQQDLIERRRGAVRLTGIEIEIWKGSALEGRWAPDRSASSVS